MPPTDTSLAFADALINAGPHPNLTSEQQIFAPFIGSWDLDVRWFGPDGKLIRAERGEWHFSWVLQGRAIQDVWIVPPRGEIASAPTITGYEYGTSIRFYDEDIGAWRSMWIGPVQRSLRRFIARKVNDEVILDTLEDETPRMRWCFSAIGSGSFAWRNEVCEDGKWRIQQSFDARRAASRQVL